MKRAIIVGASSGIGKELALILSQNDYTVGVTGRRIELLQELKAQLHTPGICREMDVSKLPEAMEILEDLIQEMGGIDLLVLSAGTGFINPDLKWSYEEETIDVNVTGFAAMANVGYRYFEKSGGGHLVVNSSIAAIRGGHDGPAYNASKAFMANYLEGLRVRAIKAHVPITVTDICPGFVNTAMAKGDGQFWVASPRRAAQQIFSATKRKARRAYITRRWVLIAFLLRLLPDFLFEKL